jgi:glycosyltransferase involved in cell wall biosynthesis
MVENLVSIIVPCYRGARFLPEAIESCLRQTRRELEVIVVDDASPDDCAEIAERYARSDSRVRVIRRPENGGVSRAFNTGLEAAHGDYFSRLAQDDLFGEFAIEVMLQHLKERPDAGLVYCDGHAIDERSVVKSRYYHPEPDEVLTYANRLGLCVMWRRAVWEKVGGFDPQFDTAEDFEYWLRIAQVYPITKCPGVAPFYARVHDAMGSKRFYQTQELATIATIHARYPTGSMSQRLLKRKALAHAVYIASTDYSSIGRRQIPAIARVLRSFALWPYPYRRGELRKPLARTKSLVVYSLRLIGIKSCC